MSNSQELTLARRAYQEQQRKLQMERSPTAQVQSSNGLPTGMVRVLRPNERASELVWGIRYRPGVWVFIERKDDAEWHITGVNVKKTIETFGAGYAAALQETYDGEATGILWGIGNLKPGKVIPSPDSPGTLKVWILAFDHAGGRFITQELDLTAYLPDASGEVLWAKIGVDTTTNAPVVDTSADYLYPANAMLQVDDMLAIDLGDGVIDLEGVSLRYGQTDIAASRFESARRMLQANGAVAGVAVLYDKTLSSAGLFDTNSVDDYSHTGVDQTYTDLIMIVQGAAASGTPGVEIYINGDTTTAHYIGSRSIDSGAASSGQANEIGFVDSSGGYAGFESKVLGYSKTGKPKHLATWGVSGTSPTRYDYWTYYNQSGEITRIQLQCRSAVNFEAGSRFRIIGMK